LINSQQFLKQVIHDLNAAAGHYPQEISIWQALGDAYLRSDKIQQALDAYTKAEELLR
jgi:cytochrome c-type biogenesis protein CcmH/NrfG